MIGVIEDKEEAEVNGLPEFPVAVRTQLLVGETTYAIQSQPAYAAAFTKTEDAVEDVLVQVRRHLPTCNYVSTGVQQSSVVCL